MAAITNDRMIAGPACSAAAWPVITKMPPPITAPMPSAVRPQGPSVRFRLGPSSTAALLKSVFFASNWSSMGIPDQSRGARSARGRREAGLLGFSVAGRARSAALVGEVAAAVAVDAVEDEADRRPGHEHDLCGHAEVDE